MAYFGLDPNNIVKTVALDSEIEARKNMLVEVGKMKWKNVNGLDIATVAQLWTSLQRIGCKVIWSDKDQKQGREFAR